MKILTDFRKTVETGMDARLSTLIQKEDLKCFKNSTGITTTCNIAVIL